MMKFHKTFLINLSLEYISNLTVVQNGLYTSYPCYTASFLKKTFKKTIEAFDKLAYKTREIIKANRKPRKHKPKNPILWFVKDFKVA